MAELTNQGTAGPSINATTTGLTVVRRRDGVFEVNNNATVPANAATVPANSVFSLTATDSATLIWVGTVDEIPTMLGNLISIGTPMLALNLSTPSPDDRLLREPLAAGGRQLIAQRTQP